MRHFFAEVIDQVRWVLATRRVGRLSTVSGHNQDDLSYLHLNASGEKIRPFPRHLEAISFTFRGWKLDEAQNFAVEAFGCGELEFEMGRPFPSIPTLRGILYSVRKSRGETAMYYLSLRTLIRFLLIHPHYLVEGRKFLFDIHGVAHDVDLEKFRLTVMTSDGAIVPLNPQIDPVGRCFLLNSVDSLNPSFEAQISTASAIHRPAASSSEHLKQVMSSWARNISRHPQWAPRVVQATGSVSIAHALSESGTPLPYTAAGRLVTSKHAGVGRLTVLTSVVPQGSDENAELLTSHAQFTPGHRLVRDVEVWHGFLVTKEDKLFIREDGADPRLAFVAGLYSYVWGTSLTDRSLVITPTRTLAPIGEAIILCGRVDTNWFHWVVETLPQLMRIDEVVSPNVPVLLRDDMPSTAYELLRLLSARPLIRVGQDDRVLVRLAHLSLFRSCAYDTPVINRLRGAFDATGLDLLRARLARLNSHMGSSGPERIFAIRDSGYRNIINAKYVSSILSRHGYLHLDPARLSAAAQASAFSGVRHAEIQGGAAMANVVFMRPGAVVDVLVSNKPDQILFWSNFLTACGIEGACIEGKSVGRKSNHADFKVPVAQLRQAIERQYDVRSVNSRQ